MRTTLLTLALLVAGSVSVLKAQSNITIKGKIEGIPSGRLYLTAQVSETKVDTFGIADFRSSSFEMKTRIPEPLVAKLSVGGYSGGFDFIAEPGETYDALLSNDSKAYIRGGKLQDAWTSYVHRQAEQRRATDALKARYDSLRDNNKFRSASMANDSLLALQKAIHAETEAFLHANDNILAAHTYNTNTQMREASLEETKRMYDEMGAGARQTVSARIMKERIDRMSKTVKGRPAPDFTMPDLNGNNVTLSKVKGKIKLVDFWASWCGPCRLNNPILRKIYSEYHPKGLEIIGVSLDHDKTRWADAVKKDQLPWIQVSSLKGWKCDVARLYNITAVPAIFVLDEENHIIATNLRGEALAAFLKEKLDNNQ